MRCEKCKRIVHVGDWPHCPHDSTRPERAQRFKPFIVFKKTDGTYSFPPSDTSKTPKHYRRLEITTRRQADKLTREVSRQLREEKASIGPTPLDSSDSGLHNLRKLARGERVMIPDHDNSGNLIMRELDGSQMRPEFKEYVAQLADRMSQPSYTSSYDPGFYIDVLENDSTNRLAHDDPSTGWRSRRE